MSGALEIAAVGLRVQQRALETVANNISNVNTPAFKRNRTEFSEIVVSRLVDGTDGGGDVGFSDQLSGVQAHVVPDFLQQGELRSTGQSLDLAIDGAGFIELMGPEGRALYWRGGRLRIMEDGSLANSDGLPLKAAVSIPTDAINLAVMPDGTVTATVADGAERVEVGQIHLVHLAAEGDLQRLSGGLYRLDDDSRALEGVAGEDGLGTLVQGALEQSTVSFNEEMIQMLMVQRAFAANAQVVQAADQLLGIANNLRRA